MTRIVGTLALGIAFTQAVNVRADDKQELAKRAQEILRVNCYRCHGENGAVEGGMNYVLDVKSLLARKAVVPGDPAKSRLFKRATSASSPMPPEEEKVRPSKDDIALLKQWIEAGAPDVQAAAAERQFITDADVVEYIAADLDAMNERYRRFARYFTISHLYNAGLPEDQMQTYRLGLSKLVNSLSWERDIAVPRAVDPAKTIFHIDLRHYRWSVATWQRMLVEYPYGVVYDTPRAREVYAATDFDLPYVRADWFVFAASRPPLYHEFLQLPKTDRDLERELKIDVEANLRDEWVARAGFNSSGVSRNNRLIERHASPFGAYWKSYDFAGNTGRQNLFANPLGPNPPFSPPSEGGAGGVFQHDGGEIIFNLPNGLQAYLLVDARGSRIDEGPTKIVSVKNKPNPTVINGISCMFCHARGMIDKADQVRAHVEKNPFPESTARTVQALYKPEAEFRALLEKDAAQFQKAVEATGAKVGATEPIVALAERFEAEVDLPSAAAELGLTPAAFLEALGKTRELASRLGGLKVQGQTVQRDVLVNGFEELVEEFGLGAPLHRLAKLISEKSDAIKRTPNNPSPYFERGNAHFDRGDYERAIADYTDAIRFQIKGADVFLFRGMAHANRRDYARAIEDYGVAIRLEPQRAESYHQRGLALAKNGQQRAAVRDLSEAVRLDPQDAEALGNRGVVLGQLGEHVKALADFDAALRLRPEDVSNFVRRGDVLVRKGDHRLAIAAYDEAIRRGLKGANVYLRRGEAHALNGAYAAALADYRTAVRVDPRSANAHNGIAWLLAVVPDDGLRDGKTAIEHARRACELSAYANFEHLDTLAAAHAECSGFPDAVKWATKAIELADRTHRPEIQARLELYRQAKPFRLSAKEARGGGS